MQRPQLALINHLIAQQPELAAEFARLAGRRVRLEGGPLAVTGVIDGQGLWARCAGEPEAVVRIGAGVLVSRVTGREVSSADISVSGDAELAGELARLAGKLRWDGAEDLSRLVGDMAAERLARSARLALGLKGEIAARLGMSLIEHWREEAPLLARRADVERFCHEVDELRDASARLQKRLERLS